MIRYGFAIKALPKSGKPFGDEEDQDDTPELENGPLPEDGAPASAGAAVSEPNASSSGVEGDTEAAEEPPLDETGPEPDDRSSSTDGDAAAGPESDARPWSGDPYDEGDETDPADAFAAYKGPGGEEAWLDQAPDGTLTGWVRDETGQVWRYTDPSVWAIDVDDAPMTRTHSQATAGPPPDEHGGQDPLFPPTR
ncbi:hypothetical protein [Streptomyces sp. NPDC004435]|uniref:hypothetical protein n=1 Tax=Streptomyces sp. NPDC004435 TaxID=3364701 RepID=UPI00369A04EE